MSCRTKTGVSQPEFALAKTCERSADCRENGQFASSSRNRQQALRRNRTESVPDGPDSISEVKKRDVRQHAGIVGHRPVAKPIRNETSNRGHLSFAEEQSRPSTSPWQRRRLEARRRRGSVRAAAGRRPARSPQYGRTRPFSLRHGPRRRLEAADSASHQSPPAPRFHDVARLGACATSSSQAVR